MNSKEKAKMFKTMLLRIMLSLLLRRKKVFLLFGLRRSGNHACISWLANSLENDSDVEFKELKKWHCYISENGETLFLNEVNILTMKGALLLLINYRRKLAKSKNVIFSFEDCLPSNYENHFRFKVIKIVIKRSLLNLIASRIKRAVEQAKLGLEKGDMQINQQFFSQYSFICTANEYQYMVWDYDRWLIDLTYRKEFLALIGLSFDSAPSPTQHGGGSSFDGQKKGVEAQLLSSRYLGIEWPGRILEILKSEEYASLMNDDEKNFLSGC